MNGGRHKRIPVHFIPSPLAVDVEGALQILSLDKRPRGAARKAFSRLRALNGIPKLPGGVFSVRAIERAVGA